jgi:hypothetical protein
MASTGPCIAAGKASPAAQELPASQRGRSPADKVRALARKAPRPGGKACRRLRNSPYAAEKGAAGTANGAPFGGAVACHVRPGYQACTFSAGVGKPRPCATSRGAPSADSPAAARLPRLVARGYPAAVPGRMTVRTPFLRRIGAQRKTQSVINS